MRSAIFIDGAYLSSVLKKHHGGPHLSYEKVAAYLSLGHELLRTYYYDAPPYQSNPPTPEESKKLAAKQSFFSALRKLPRYDVREGRCGRIWDRDKNTWKYIQKRVDVLFAVDLVRLASKQQIQRAVLVAGDSDFLPAVHVAKDEGVVIEVVHSPDRSEIHRELWDAADDRREIDVALVKASKR